MESSILTSKRSLGGQAVVAGSVSLQGASERRMSKAMTGNQRWKRDPRKLDSRNPEPVTGNCRQGAEPIQERGLVGYSQKGSSGWAAKALRNAHHLAMWFRYKTWSLKIKYLPGFRLARSGPVPPLCFPNLSFWNRNAYSVPLGTASLLLDFLFQRTSRLTSCVKSQRRSWTWTFEQC